MVEPFQPDLFSVPGPRWAPVDAELAGIAHRVLDGCGDVDLIPVETPQQSQGLEINSNNLRITTHAGRLILKRWSKSATVASIDRTLRVMEHLAGRGLPVPAPLRVNDRLVIEQDDSCWSLFPFVEGSWFVGSTCESTEAASVSARVSAALAQLPGPLQPPEGPRHLTDADDAFVARMDHERVGWPAMLGVSHSSMLSAEWRLVLSEWRRLRDNPPEPGPVQAAHFDLHPHNFLVQSEHVTAVLDFEACATMPIGYALAFAGLKQGRQTVVAQGNAGLARRIGAAFLEGIRGVYPVSGVHHFADLALAEVLRRLVLILRLNAEQGVRTWNKVLPMQLAHLREARLLFTTA